MTGGLVSFGCRLYAASWRSPTASKNSPVAHTTTPATTNGHQSASSTAPTITGRATNHWTTPCTRKTRRATTPMPIWEGGPPTISASRGSSLPPCSPTARPRMCQTSRSPQRATIAATSQRRQPVPSSSTVPTTAAARAISTKPAPHATSTTAPLSSCRARTAAAVIPAAAASSPARRTIRIGSTCVSNLGALVGGSSGGSAELGQSELGGVDDPGRAAGAVARLHDQREHGPALPGQQGALPRGQAELDEGVEQADPLVAHPLWLPPPDLHRRLAPVAVRGGVRPRAGPDERPVVREHGAGLGGGPHPDDRLGERERRPAQRVVGALRATGAAVGPVVVAVQRRGREVGRVDPERVEVVGAVVVPAAQLGVDRLRFLERQQVRLAERRCQG